MEFWEFIVLYELICHTCGLGTLNFVLPVDDFIVLFTPRFFYRIMGLGVFKTIIAYMGYMIFVPIFGILGLVKWLYLIIIERKNNNGKI